MIKKWKMKKERTDDKILMLLQKEEWNRVLAFLLCAPGTGDTRSQQSSVAGTGIPQGTTGFGGGAGEQRVVQAQAGREEMSDAS